MIRSFSLRTRCATASSRASGEPDAGLACVEREAAPDARGVRLDAAPPERDPAPPERVPREADELREVELRADELREDALREDDEPLDDPLAVERLVPPLRADELDDGFAPPLREPPLLEPLLLAWGTSPP
jgi:hypothetical protein